MCLFILKCAMRNMSYFLNIIQYTTVIGKNKNTFSINMYKINMKIQHFLKYDFFLEFLEL